MMSEYSGLHLGVSTVHPAARIQWSRAHVPGPGPAAASVCMAVMPYVLTAFMSPRPRSSDAVSMLGGGCSLTLNCRKQTVYINRARAYRFTMAERKPLRKLCVHAHKITQ